MKFPRWYQIILACLMAMTGACRSKQRITVTVTPPNPIVEMLVSERAEVVSEGERLLAADQDQLFNRLLKDAASGDAKVSGRAAVELGILISPWLRGKEAGERFVSYTHFPSPRRPVERMPGHPRAAEIRNALQSSIAKLIDQPRASRGTVEEALEALSETLGEVADDETIDWALEQLAKSGYVPPGHMDPLADLVTGYVGIPPVSSGRAICGNISGWAVARFRQSEKKRIADSRATLQEIWQKVQPMPAKDRISFSIGAWRDNFEPLQRRYAGPY